LLSGPPNQKSRSDVIRLSDGQSKQKLVTFAGTNRALVLGNRTILHQDKNLRVLDRERYTEMEGKRQALLGTKKKTAEDEAEIKRLAGEATKAVLWTKRFPIPIDLIVAGNSLILGLDQAVAALDSNTGRELWRAPISGRACGLAVANGRLFVSTDLGHIYCFQPGGEA
ncbi:MAG: PQQ-binding-like beta-propeller repeat protein, partial [Verrucomicrobiota bacterium]